MGKNKVRNDSYASVGTPHNIGDQQTEATIKRDEKIKFREPSPSFGEEQKPAESATSFSFFQLYRFATVGDKVLLGFGVLMATISGILLPLMAVVFGDVLNGFSVKPIDMDAVDNAALNYFLIAIGLFFADYFAYVSFYYSAERQMKALRSATLRHLLHLDVSWYDSNDALELSSRLTGDTVRIKDGMGQKLGNSFKFLAQFITGFVIGFSKGWDMTLIMAVVMPLNSISLKWMIKLMQSTGQISQQVYAEAGAVAEETIGSMRTVTSLNAQNRAIDKFKAKILAVEEKNIALSKVVGAAYGAFLGSIWFVYAAGLWYGGHKIVTGHASPGQVFSAFFGVMSGMGAVAQIQPSVGAVSRAIGSATEIFKILDTPSAIDASSDEGTIPVTCEGIIEAVDLNFTYPSRPDAPVLKNYNLKVESGQTVAFVGSSGGGKSTLIALLERFYDPTSGTLLLDGRDTQTLNVKWLRAQIGLVAQEPVLFAGTIYENIVGGRLDVTQEQVIAAAKLANAHDFICSLPEKYDTRVGEKGLSLSGGQKQRVAIARAVAREPKILVLDEATSALDNESERIVQAALNNLMDKTQMTTLVIAHRLSTIRHADKIVVLNEGHIVESGKHDELLTIDNGIYKNMYHIQQMNADEEEENTGTGELRKAEFMHRSSVVSTQTDICQSDVENNTLEKVKFGWKELFTLVWPQRLAFGRGCLCAVVIGFSMPGSAILVSGMITTMTNQYTLYNETSDRSHLNAISHDVMIYGLIYIGGGFVLVFFTWMLEFNFGFVTEKATTQLRLVNFTALCRQNVGFFDEKENATGALTANLATNATKVTFLLGESFVRLVIAFFTTVAALVISFVFGSWVLSLIMLVVIPLLIIGSLIRMKQQRGMNAISDQLSVPGAHASECLTNIRTIASLGLEDHSSDKFDHLLELPMQQGKKEAQINGMMLGYSSFITMATYSLTFYVGGHMVNHGSIEFKELIRTLMAVMMSIMGISGATSYFSSAETAYASGSRIFSLRDRSVPIDSSSEDGLRPWSVEGRIEFKDIHFRYPTRPEVTVLKRYNLTIEAGQTVAFCGPSGGGKSTIISLIERFYDPIRGQVMLDGHDIRDFNLGWLRSQIGLVGQEPTLFIGTIAENIAYGLDTMPSQDEIEAAAKMANAHDFITQFPDGYQTQVGLKGEQLSGGQKQRIAIARAILKNPSIFLLDEATSALDSESERIVQDALDRVVALKKRTTIVIAHRLSTIRKADKICVVSGGRIAEQGTHNELLALNGIYATLVE